jgi:hypothetical protein
LYADFAAQPPCAARAAFTASRMSLREPRGAFATGSPSLSVAADERPDSDRTNTPPT